MTGFWRTSFLPPSALLDFLGDKKRMGLIFSESSSKVVALRLEGEESVGNAIGDVRFMIKE